MFSAFVSIQLPVRYGTVRHITIIAAIDRTGNTIQYFLKMGCCCAKEASVAQPEDKNGATTPDDGGRKSSRKSARKSASDKNSGASSPSPADSDEPSGPAAPAHSIPASGPQAPPPGWGGTPELEEEEEEEQNPAERASGPRDIKNIAGDNGYISGTRKDQDISEGVMDRIKGLEAAGLQTKKKMGRKMLTPRIITDVKETWDREGNITREMTHYTENPDGTKSTTKETVHIAAGEPDPLAAAE